MEKCDVRINSILDYFSQGALQTFPSIVLELITKGIHITAPC